MAALAPPQPGRARPGPAAGLRGAALQPPPAPRLLAGPAGDRRADHRGRGGDGRGPGGQGVRAGERADPPPGGRGQLDPRPEPGGGAAPRLLHPPAGHPAAAQPGRDPLVRRPAGHRRPDHPRHAGRLQRLPAAAHLAAAGAGDAVRLRPAGRGQRRADLRGARPTPGHRRPAGARPPCPRTARPGQRGTGARPGGPSAGRGSGSSTSASATRRVAGPPWPGSISTSPRGPGSRWSGAPGRASRPCSG